MWGEVDNFYATLQMLCAKFYGNSLTYKVIIKKQLAYLYLIGNLVNTECITASPVINLLPFWNYSFEIYWLAEAYANGPLLCSNFYMWSWFMWFKATYIIAVVWQEGYDVPAKRPFTGYEWLCISEWCVCSMHLTSSRHVTLTDVGTLQRWLLLM